MSEFTGKPQSGIGGGNTHSDGLAAWASDEYGGPDASQPYANVIPCKDATVSAIVAGDELSSIGGPIADRLQTLMLHSATDNLFAVVTLSGLSFDTGSIPANAVISAASLSMTIDTAVDDLSAGASGDMVVADYSPGDAGTITTADWKNHGTTIYGDLPIASIVGGVNTITLDPSAITKAGITSLALMHRAMVTGTYTGITNPGATAVVMTIWHSAESAGGEPTLTVTYTVPGTLEETPESGLGGTHADGVVAWGSSEAGGVGASEPYANVIPCKDATISAIAAGDHMGSIGGTANRLQTQIIHSATDNLFASTLFSGLAFDTSAIPVDATISSASLTLLEDGTSVDQLSCGASGDVVVASYTPADAGTIATGDFKNHGTTIYGSLPMASIVATSLNTISLDAAAINKGGITALALMHRAQVTGVYSGDTSPGMIAWLQSAWHSAESAGNEPLLTVVYSTSSGETTSLLTPLMGTALRIY